MIIINIRVTIYENHRVESSRRHIGTTTEHNANILNFTFPEQINEYATVDLECNLIFETSNGESYVYPISSNTFSIPRTLTNSNYFDMQIQFTNRLEMDWKSFPIRYELVNALNNSNINSSVEQQESDLTELIAALSDATGSDYTGFTWSQALNEITTLKDTSGLLSAAIEEVTGISQRDKTFDDIVDNIVETYENFDELVGGMEKVLGITGGDSNE